MEITSDICHVIIRAYPAEDYGKEKESAWHQYFFERLNEKFLDDLIEALQRAKEHHEKMNKIWDANGQLWLSSNGGKEPGPTDEQNRIYCLPWEEKND